MKKQLFAFICLLIFCSILSACSLLPKKEAPVDYAMLEQTAALRLTQTFEAMPTATATNTPVPTDTPIPTATDTAVPEIEEEVMITRRDNATPTAAATAMPTATVYFPDKAEFIAVLPSPNEFVPNQHFYLTWQIKNTGTSTWSGKYRFYHNGGIQLGDSGTYSITEVVKPGGILTIAIPSTAPETEGTYTTTWTLENPDGIPFYNLNYTANVGDRTYITPAPDLNPSATPSTLEWMCSDAERSMLQGDGCIDYCDAAAKGLESVGMACYANGERIYYEE